MTAYRLLVGMIALAVLIAGWLLVPRREEQVAMLTRDGYYDMASRSCRRCKSVTRTIRAS